MEQIERGGLLEQFDASFPPDFKERADGGSKTPSCHGLTDVSVAQTCELCFFLMA